MICPLIKDACVKQACAWWDHGSKCCAVLGLLIERVKATEAIQDGSGGGSNAVVIVNPIVHVKEIIKTIPILEAKHERTIIPSDQASEIPSKITWGVVKDKGISTGITTQNNARTERQDVGNNTKRADSNWSQNQSGQNIVFPTDLHGHSITGHTNPISEPGNDSSINT